MRSLRIPTSATRPDFRTVEHGAAANKDADAVAALNGNREQKGSMPIVTHLYSRQG
jgi:hypothetical protein